MTTVSISPKYQVVIPMEVRKALNIKPGQKLQVMCYRGRIELVPGTPMQSARGFLAGIDTTIEGEDARG